MTRDRRKCGYGEGVLCGAGRAGVGGEARSMTAAGPEYLARLATMTKVDPTNINVIAKQMNPQTIQPNGVRGMIRGNPTVVPAKLRSALIGLSFMAFSVPPSRQFCVMRARGGWWSPTTHEWAARAVSYDLVAGHKQRLLGFISAEVVFGNTIDFCLWKKRANTRDFGFRNVVTDIERVNASLAQP